MKKPTGKTYEIDSFEKFVNTVNCDNYERLLLDFANWLRYNCIFMKGLRKKHPKMTRGKSNYELLKTSFIWTDDGETKINYVRIKNELTGEVQTIHFTEK
jgi:hypothetical protein